MNTFSNPNEQEPAATRVIPRWLNALSLTSMGVLLALVLVFVFAFATAGGEDNLALVTLLVAGIIAIPLLAAALLWVTGTQLQHRYPRLALALVFASVIPGFSLFFIVMTWFRLR